MRKGEGEETKEGEGEETKEGEEGRDKEGEEGRGGGEEEKETRIPGTIECPYHQLMAKMSCNNQLCTAVAIYLQW